MGEPGSSAIEEGRRSWSPPGIHLLGGPDLPSSLQIPEPAHKGPASRFHRLGLGASAPCKWGWSRRGSLVTCKLGVRLNKSPRVHWSLGNSSEPAVLSPVPPEHSHRTQGGLASSAPDRALSPPLVHAASSGGDTRNPTLQARPGCWLPSPSHFGALFREFYPGF